MDCFLVPDTAIVSVPRGKSDGEPHCILYRDSGGCLNTIDFAACAANFAAEHPDSSGRCIGLRNADEHWFLFYTSGQKTKIVFEKPHVGIFHRPFSLTGSLTARFLSLWCSINGTNYTTYDLT